MGCTLPPYIKEGGRRRPALGGARQGSRIPTPSWSRFPPFLVQLGEGGKGGKRGRKGERGRAPNPLSNSDWAWEGHAPPPGPSHYGPLRPIASFSYSRNSPVPPKIPESLETFPMSEYSRPIYQSLHLDHFETPRHVPDLIRDSELPSVHQNT